MEADSSPSTGRYVSEERHVTPEQEALAEMAYRLSSSNEVGEHEDDGSTRREAKLLMSLSAFPQTPDQSDLDLISSSESDSSYMSDSSRSESFTFVCPSLSLESAGSALQHAYRSEKRNLARKVDEAFPKASDPNSSPAKLLGRPLKADDRDAVRLSADAMARNVYDSFRKAIEWRISAWTATLCKSLAHKEKTMLASGSNEEDLKVLLSSSEAALILGLRNLKGAIKVNGTRTTFTVLPQRVDNDGDHSFKKRRVTPSGPQLEEGEYQYNVAHSMRFECIVELDTPVGFSEVSLEVPGTIEGTFLSSGYDREEMTFVALDLNTDMLAAMVEKACRKLVRVSLETALKSSKPEAPKESPAQTKSVTFAAQATPKPKNSARSLITEFATPPKATTSTVSSPEAVRAALVSPPSRHHMETNAETPIPSNTFFLSPIPDDLDSFTPRRISPAPRSAGFKNSFPTMSTPYTPKVPITKGSVLVSPPPGETVYHDTTGDKGPSLPMLVEVACRAYRDD
uniref:Uncharacterized protein n=1 Tax=Entomoneis paludosa TaxID=265537 RepID=A0A7S2YGS8_9STRA|eukprot:CAMPEP_0172439050 /NCGR_PEP_ID=MMETSP1065-20121228/161_1 /TAXON_ID=265537 /ORGANISM="Amphiprora paludosa, Strain CCMP125" /LENGTH=512 /DNA_ID=CAMNT_0013187677 /DNA_START=35 /DNA_END=1573 /DNA_ORIENTATION=-